MKATKYILIFLGISLFLYLIIINLISIQINQTNGNQTKAEYSGETQKVNVGDSVSVLIVRQRWYGKIYEDNSKNLYLFNLIKIPIESNNKNYTSSHLVFISCWFLILIITLIFEFSLRKIYKEENTN
jgi:hypothetical protein